MNEAGALSRKEQITIARAKTLFVKLQGDTDFAPAALAAMSNESFREAWTNGENGRASRAAPRERQDVEMQDTAETYRDANIEDSGHAEPPNGIPYKDGTNGETQPEPMDGREPTTNGTRNEDPERLQENGEAGLSPMADDASDTASQQTAHRMTTRARAHAASTPSPPGSPSSGVNAIHPLFTFSTDSLPDRDLGIPPSEAEETRMLLMAYVQKQEEVARVTSDLYHGLLQADRMRQEVFSWSKAEGHVGEMSDGEDWYDNEEWGLDQDLIKGREEEEDDTAVAGKKSTRQRRKPDKDDR